MKRTWRGPPALKQVAKDAGPYAASLFPRKDWYLLESCDGEVISCTLTGRPTSQPQPMDFRLRPYQAGVMEYVADGDFSDVEKRALSWLSKDSTSGTSPHNPGHLGPTFGDPMYKFCPAHVILINGGPEGLAFTNRAAADAYIASLLWDANAKPAPEETRISIETVTLVDCTATAAIECSDRGRRLVNTAAELHDCKEPAKGGEVLFDKSVAEAGQDLVLVCWYSERDGNRADLTLVPADVITVVSYIEEELDITDVPVRFEIKRPSEV